jgi:hypothetical protein
LHNIVAFNTVFPMNPSTSMPTENREVDQLRVFIDETTSEVVDARNKFSNQ